MSTAGCVLQLVDLLPSHARLCSRMTALLGATVYNRPNRPGVGVRTGNAWLQLWAFHANSRQVALDTRPSAAYFCIR